jgi:hypothetical protein
MTSATSPYLFKEENEKDVKFIDSEIVKNNYAMFIRKIAPEFPNTILRHYIYDQNKDLDDKLIIREPSIFIYNRYKNKIYITTPYIAFAVFIYFLYYYLI